MNAQCVSCDCCCVRKMEMQHELWKQLSMPVAVVFAGWMMGGGQIAWQMQNDE